jgi:hypothetical protein
MVFNPDGEGGTPEAANNPTRPFTGDLEVPDGGFRLVRIGQLSPQQRSDSVRWRSAPPPSSTHRSAQSSDADDDGSSGSSSVDSSGDDEQRAPMTGGEEEEEEEESGGQQCTLYSIDEIGDMIELL